MALLKRSASHRPHAPAGTADVVVVGAGIVGAAGLSVTVVDRSAIGAGTTGSGEGNIRSWPRSRHGRRPRGLFCGIGACFDCLVTVDGGPPVRACVTPAEPGAVVAPPGPVTAPPGPWIVPPDAGVDPADRRAVDAVVEVAVIGAGPAGLAAAVDAADAGRRVTLIDSVLPLLAAARGLDR